MSIKPLIYNRRNADEARQLLMTLKSPNRLPISAIENAVTSVNGQIGDVVIPLGETGDFQPKSEILTHLSSMDASLTGMLWQENGDFTVSPVSSFIRSIMSSPNEAFLRGMLSLGSASTLDTNVPNGIPTLGEDGKIPSSMLPSVAGFSGSYNDLSDKPELFSGNYEDLENKPVIPEVNYPVSSVNSKTGDVILTASDVNAAPVQHGHTIAAVSGLQTALDSKISAGSTIPYSSITGVPIIPAAQIQSDWQQTDSTAKDFIKNKPSIPVLNYPVLSVNGKVGTVSLTNTDIGAAATVHGHSISDISGLQIALDSKLTSSSVIPYTSISGVPTIPVNNSFSFVGLNDTDNTVVNSGYLKWNSTGTSVQYDSTIPYTSITGTPAIPTNTSQLTNGAGFITASQAASASPVQSVNGKTGAITLTASDVGAAPTAQGTKYYRQAGTQATGVKVKYYSVTSDANGAWTLNLGSDFTELLDVQAQAVSTAGITGVRQSTVNAFSSNSTTISGMTWGNTVLVTVLVSGTNSLSLTPNTVVRVRVEGVGP